MIRADEDLISAVYAVAVLWGRPLVHRWRRVRKARARKANAFSRVPTMMRPAPEPRVYREGDYFWRGSLRLSIDGSPLDPIRAEMDDWMRGVAIHREALRQSIVIPPLMMGSADDWECHVETRPNGWGAQ